MGTKSSTRVDSSAKTATDQGRVTTLQGKGNKFGTSDVTVGKGGTLTVNSTSTDHGAIASAFDFANDSYKESIGFGAKSLDLVGSLAAASQASANSNTRQIGELAENFRSDGESRTQKTVVVLAGVAGVIVVVGIIAWAWSNSK